MSDHEVKAHKVKNGKAMQSVNPQQSSWLTHWAGTRSEASPSTRDHLTNLSRSREDDHDIKQPNPHIPIGVEVASGNFRSSKNISDVDLAMSSRNPVTESFPIFKIGPESGKRSYVSNDKEPQVSPKKMTTAFNEETPSRNCCFEPDGVKYHMFFGESNYLCSRPSNEKIDTRTAREPENFRQLTAVLKDYSQQTNSIMEQEPSSKMPPFSRQNNTALLKIDPSTSTNHSPASIKERYQKMQKHFRTGAKSESMHHGPFSSQNLPHFVHDVETTRICTHSLVITKQTDVNLYQENQFYRESRVSTQFKGSTPFFAHSQQGLKLQLLDSSSDHESHEHVEDLKTVEKVQKNESSADTDAMDMESLHPPPQIPFPAVKDRSKKHKIELPDMNLELSALPATSSSTDNAEPCMSRTQSLDMNAVRINSKSDDCSESNHGPEPESRWIKRLKLSSSSSPALGTKSSNLAEAFSHGKLNKFFTRATESKPKQHKGSDSETTDTCKDITLSHSWIQRWSCKNREKAYCKTEKAKMALEELEKKQFPSIAAMALMGKAMSGFQRCEFQKKESFVVWNTKGF